MEVSTPADRRADYPFTTCVECGPRFSIVNAMPYDRVRTSLGDFPLCDACSAEYGNPFDRRFHAQAIACPHCGPQVWCTDRWGHTVATGQEAVNAAITVLCSDGIVAMRGIGGYQLICDATSDATVRTLRERKQRPLKPFAVLCCDLAAAETLAILDDAERAALVSPQNPIVLLRRKSGAQLSDSVCCGAATVGILLPTTPLHQMLAESVRHPLVCTSGNRDGEPIGFRPDEAQECLAGIADLFLHHNRDIIHPIDDSLVRLIAGRRVTIRCARGLAPLPLEIDSPRSIVATGGYLKGAFALTNGTQAILGPHVGDLDSEATRLRWEQQLAALMDLYRVKNIDWVCDAHPDYSSTTFAASRHSPPSRVWHHHAHVAAGALEHGLLDQTVLGVAFDGTGLGPDGSVWGGEFLEVKGESFRRVGHLQPFALLGGEVAIRDARRLAAAVAFQLPTLSLETLSALIGVTREELGRLRQLAETRFVTRTTSCGRLFDAVAALALGISEIGYEGYAAACLEGACDESAEGEYPFKVAGQEPWVLDWRPVIEAVIDDLLRGVDPGAIAMRFHRGLARGIVEACQRTPALPVVLSGGVFQNRRLVEEVIARWPGGAARLVWPCKIPPNDGGLAAGQLAVAAMSLRKG